MSPTKGKIACPHASTVAAWCTNAAGLRPTTFNVAVLYVVYVQCLVLYVAATQGGAPTGKKYCFEFSMQHHLSSSCGEPRAAANLAMTLTASSVASRRVSPLGKLVEVRMEFVMSRQNFVSTRSRT